MVPDTGRSQRSTLGQDCRVDPSDDPEIPVQFPGAQG